MNKTPKNLLLLALILPVILPMGLMGVQLDYSRAAFVGEIKDSAEEVSLSVPSEISDFTDLKRESKIESDENVTEVESVESVETIEPAETLDNNNSNDNTNSSDNGSDNNSSDVITTESNFTVDPSEVCIGDLNSDGQVNNDDVQIVLTSWSPNSDSVEFSVADLNQDGAVDGADLGIVLGQWGSCPGNNSGETCFGDLNNDGQINDGDVQVVLSQWSPQSGSVEFSVADLNQDGAVDGADLGIVLGQWGSCVAPLNDFDFIQNPTVFGLNADDAPKKNLSIDSSLSPTNIGNTADETVDDTDSDDNGNDDNGGGSSGGGGSSSNNNRSGEVLGASDINNGLIVVAFSQCNEIYLKDYIKYGADNNPEEVKKLQTFLNNRGAGLPVTGFYGEKTLEAVKDFQLKFNKLILKPWFDAGRLPSDTQPTGYVYETTRFWVNAMTCGGVKNLTLPNVR